MKIDLDHVAIAASDVGPALRALVGELGARVLFGGKNFGFRAMQLDCGDLRIELLEPWDTERNDFLVRFLQANGDGPHHLTFKTDDIERDLERVSAAGYEPVGVNIDNRFWREAFIHPRQAAGTVVQIAESDMDPMAFDPANIPEDMRDIGPAQWWPDPPPAARDRTVLRRVVVTIDEMARSVELYRDLLGGERVDSGEGWADLGWPSGGRIRLEHAAGRQQGIDRLDWTHHGEHRELNIGGTRFVLYPEGS